MARRGTKSSPAAILGAGQMGRGIAHVFALAGFAVDLYDSNAAAAAGAPAAIGVNLARQVKKGTVSAAAAKAALARIRPRKTLGGWLAANQIVVEAASEDFAVKTALLSRASAQAASGALIASNTSSLSITALAAACDAPARVIGMHFMNPPPLMALVEIIRGLQTAPATVAETEALAGRLGKQTVIAADSPGFIANRVLMPMINEAVFALSERVGDAESIDRAMKLGMNHPLGPLALADLIGLDVCLAVMRALRRDFADSKFRPAPLLAKLVAAGRLGRKTGAGFYDYGGASPRPLDL